jgi:hypothetical protein
VVKKVHGCTGNGMDSGLGVCSGKESGIEGTKKEIVSIEHEYGNNEENW